MKKFMSVILALAMLLSLAACGGNGASQTEAPVEKAPLEGTMEELLNQIAEANPAEFMGGVMPVDVTDGSEDGLANLKYFTGLDTNEGLAEAAVYEPMIGSIAFSMVMVRVTEGADAQAVAEAMQAGIDQRKWICVEADDLKVARYDDVVMLIMVASDSGLTAQSYVDAFASLCPAELDFTV